MQQHVPPILCDKHYDDASAFTPESILKEARRQKGLTEASVPVVCVLDPDGDMVRQLKAAGRARKDEGWACYHTELYRVNEADIDLGIVPCAVGASFAVLIAEQLFVSGCKLLISVTSSGQLAEIRPPPYFVLIDKALRDEGTSYHYLPPSEFSAADPALLESLAGAFDEMPVPVERGGTWTTDAPFRETAITSLPCGIRAYLLWRWKLPRSTHLRRLGAGMCSASHTLPIAWVASTAILRRVRPMDRSTRCP